MANDLSQFPGTRVKTSFIKIHLQRISPFLVTGVDVWWSYTSNHFIEDVEHRRDACWKRIVDEKIVIPAHSIKLYDSDGNKKEECCTVITL